ncbi:hypothetical protein LY71_1267 [Geodermatophilus tzadiensis]|uniref:Uncharacterized protein n=1 Tax=Geodermatophilus tzadiensis TaxID=1137988 RepID=A0A2T0SRL5_9ACTN|nr:hypothetical protein LY71_1267 [Geodermatophilus tzadiensis]
MGFRGFSMTFPISVASFETDFARGNQNVDR